VAEFKTIKTDILILGSGGAGLMAAIHAHDANPQLDITIAVKGLLGKCGCTRMVQGGYNVAIAEGDSIERHFMDSIEGGKWINNQELSWRLVVEAVNCISKLENQFGCFFDRNPDGTVHQKAFAGQTFDRTVHKGDLTGIEIINRLAEQVWSRGINRLEEHRAIAFVRDASNTHLAGVVLINMRDGSFTFVKAKAVLLGTGGGPTMYRYHTPSGEKTCDGMVMALHQGLSLRDMEMVQFHPTGLLAGTDTRMTGTVLEEGLRGAGGYLLNGDEQRFMENYDPRGERATRDIVSRAMYEEIRKGKTTPNGGLYISMGHLGAKEVARKFKGMVERCADCGFDLAGGLVEVVPTAHYMMGGLIFNQDCSTGLPGLFAAGEDTGGVHGANRLGGNGVANSTVFGAISGVSMADYAGAADGFLDADLAQVEAAIDHVLKPFGTPAGDLNALREELLTLMWEKVGILRNADDLNAALVQLDDLEDRLHNTGIGDQSRSFNLTWHDWINLESQIVVSKVIVHAALAREDSRGAHFREDFPETGDLEKSRFTSVHMEKGKMQVTTQPVEFTIVKPGQSLIGDDPVTAPGKEF
jgi:succinate dehydrogenase flavoprotein subunit